MDSQSFVDASRTAKTAFENVKVKGKLTGADEASISALGDESVKFAKVFLSSIGRKEDVGKVEVESLLREETYEALAERGWLLSDQIQRSIERGAIEEDAQDFADSLVGPDGAWQLQAICTELTQRSKRKTVGGLKEGQDFPVGTPPWAIALIADVKAIREKLEA
jgi:cyclopropane fatty-acyl-phospholipid synthase-like methyltransferase